MKRLFTVIFPFLVTGAAMAQLPVSKLGVEQGLSNETIRSIYQDKKGFMWFGTLDGLNRFDGYSFKVYQNKFGDTTSLLSNVIYGITEDHQGNLWLGTRLGVCRLDPLRNIFRTVYYQNVIEHKTIRLDRDVIKTIACDARNNILIATELKGLMICPGASLEAVQIPFQDSVGRKVYHYGVQALGFDKFGRTLAFVQGKGICNLNYKDRSLTLLNGTIKYVNNILAAGNILWTATNEGIYTYDLTANKVTKPLIKLNADIAMALAVDAPNNLFIATMGGGLNIYDPLQGKTRYLPGGDGLNDLSSSGIYSLYKDREGRLWIGTRRGGINVLDGNRSKFATIRHEPGNSNSLSGNFITSVAELANGNLLVATEDNGLNLLDKSTGRFIHYRYDAANPNSIASDNINNITIDHLGNIWLATFTNGICRLLPGTQTFKRYTTINTKTGVTNKVFNTFYEDRNQTLWASALRRGSDMGALYRYNREKDDFELFDDRLSDLFSLNEDQEGNFWGGGITDLVKIDRINHRHQFFYIGQFIRTITDDGAGHLWLGTEGGGLVLFDRKQQQIIARYTTTEGLSNNSIFSTLPDSKGNLWLGTFNGLSKFNPQQHSFKNYYRSDGLESDQFHFNAAARLHDGAFIFGGINGYNLFFPDSVGSDSGNAPLHITGIIVDGKSIALVPGYIRKTGDGAITAIAVPYNNAVFTFNFAALEYSVPNKISYAYMMDGWDKDWSYAGNNHTASYTHLREGRYVFRVKSTDRNGNWKNEIAVVVRVFPPWYRSWWAYLIYAAVASVLIYSYLKYRSKQAQLKYEVDLQKVEVQRQKAEREKAAVELALEKSEHEKDAAELETERTQRALEQSERETEKAIADKEREVAERRASFFTHISHEFRTPLTLIINPIKDILEKSALLPEKEEREMEIVYRNARRMLSLTTQLLLFRREETGWDKIHPVKLDLIELCKEVYLCFVQQAQAKNISYQFNNNEAEIELYADREKLEIVFYNLLSNALKYTPPGGSIVFSIMGTVTAANIVITDSGPGIPVNSAEKIFEKFYQAGGGKPGFGIGLYLARQFALAHQGDIKYTGTAETGAVFEVHLLKGAGHFSEEQLGQQDVPAPSVFQEIRQDLEGQEPVVPMRSAVTADTGGLVASEKQSVLVVDDDDTIREYLKLIFEERYQVYDAANGTDGLALAGKLLPDIIITDITMERLSGIDLCHKIKESAVLGHIPVILLTGTSSDALKLQGVKQGADDYIIKPFDKELLLARVANLLKNKNSLQRYFYNEITLTAQDTKIPEQYRQFLETCIRLVEEHLDDEEFTGKKLAAALGMSYSALTKRVKAVSGQSLNSFIRFVRLRKAARLFIDTTANVNEVATTIGIFDARYFREQFSKQFGMNPSEFIKKYRKPFANKFTINKDIMNKGQAG
ncbi:MAG: response regulator [Niabella sp.]|nr:response regulator [Niabella sp.]